VQDASGTVIAQATQTAQVGSDGTAQASSGTGYAWQPGAYTIVAAYDGGGGNFSGSSAQATLIVTGPGVSVTASDTATAAGGTATAATPVPQGATAPDVSATVAGTGTVTVAEYGTDPVGTAVPGAGAYTDLHLSAGNALTSATVTRCNLPAGNTSVYWWDGAAWELASPQSYDAASGCVTAGPLLIAGTSPELGQLTGTPLADGAAMPVTVTVTPATVRYGASAGYDATVAVGSGFEPDAAQPIAGTVKFSAGGTVLGSVTVGSADGASSVPASLRAVMAAGAGTASLTATFTPAAGSPYGSGSGSAALTVGPAPLTITADDAGRVFGQPDPAFTVTPSGLVNGDTLASLGGTLTVATSATQASAPGAYPLTPGGLSSPDYVITFKAGTLTIGKDAAGVALTSSARSPRYGQRVTYTATVTAAAPGSGTPAGTVTFLDGHAAIATVPLHGGTATLATGALPGGSLALTARYGGDADFTGGTSAVLAQPVAYTATIGGTVTRLVTVRGGQSVLITGKLTAGLTIDKGGAAYLRGARVTGHLTASGAAAIALCGTTVSGPVSIAGTAGFAELGGAAGTALACAADRITGTLKLSGNKGSLALDGATVRGLVTVTGTTGSEPASGATAPQITANLIVGALQCYSNKPAPTDDGQPNSVTGPGYGQCAALRTPAGARIRGGYAAGPAGLGPAGSRIMD